ncbi:uncharacterized protein N7446_010583 [Penicillium canescens]|uniref:uncharacterized protein n=1 Tax=Penicillium canescens TaxID=5083 RepID=UPI0026E0447A|nr:uncharacterized protein N7446_010583 [Penicillium canescens]KAJ6050474.1 hypothetical protein N7446_010583 [Penicillium canescens]
MRFSIVMILASAYASGSLGGTLEIIDIDGQCAIWSYDNHGCTGSSAFFGQLEGEKCSTVNEVGDRTHRYPVHGVEACGTEDNSSAAWIQVKDTGVVTFSNHQGEMSSCTLDNGLKHGSRCIASDSGSSTKASSALTTPRSSSSVSGSSLTTSQTGPSSDCSAD